MDTVIKNSLKRSMSYSEYRDLVRQLVIKNTTSGYEKSEVLTNHTKLNHIRMNRLDKTLKITEDTYDRTVRFHERVTWLLITESWCGDSANVIPVINKIADLNSNIELKIVFRDENEDLMNMFLTNGNRAVPKMIMIDDETGNVIDTYGPRPSKAAKIVFDYKAKYGKITPEFKEELQRWYLQDHGKNIIEDLTKILCQVEPNICL